MTKDLTPDDQLKAMDPEAWLSSRFITNAAQRHEFVALHLLLHEFACVATRANNPLMGEIRFAWWREGVEAAVNSQAERCHPALDVLAPALAQTRLASEPLYRVLHARHAELATPWFPDEQALDAYLDDVGGAATLAAAKLLDPQVSEASVAPCGRLLLLARLAAVEARSEIVPAWWPETWRSVTREEAERHLRSKLLAERDRARAAPALSPQGFPAIAHATLVLRGTEGPLRQRLRLMAAVLSGRI